MLELLKKLSETESLNRRGQIIKIQQQQQQQRKMRSQIADLTFYQGQQPQGRMSDEVQTRSHLLP